MAIELRGDPETGATYLIDTDTGMVVPELAASSASPYSGAGDWSKYFSQPNDFGRTGFYGVPGSVGKMLTDAARQAGKPDFDFNQYAAQVAPGYGWQLPGANGWLLGANEEQIYQNILNATGDPTFKAIAAQRSPESIATGARAGIQRDAELAKQNAAQDSGLGDIGALAMLAAAIYSGGSALGAWGAGAGASAGAAGGLGEFMAADAASMNTLAGAADWMGSAFTPGTTAAAGTTGGSMDWMNEFFGPGVDTSGMDLYDTPAIMDNPGGYTLDMSGIGPYDQAAGDLITRELGGEAAGGVAGSNSAGISDFIKGAIQSGNIEQLAKILPNIPGGATALKSILGGGGAMGGLGSMFAPSGTGTGKYSTDLGGIINSLLGYTTNKDYQNKLIDVMNRSIDAADPFKSQRPFYQAQLQSMFTDPNYFANNALLKGANDMAVNDTTRKLASQGYNMSGNVPMEVGQRLQQNNMGFAQKLMDFTGQAAGASINPSSSGTVAATTGTNVANAANAGNASLGNLFNTVWNGQQPSLADQYLGGAQKNPNLGSVLFS